MESEFLAWLNQRLPAHPQLRLGPGDDAAVLRLAGAAEAVLTVDLLTDGVDFVLSEVDPRRVGRKALAVNLSDLAAMAARPLAALVALALPRRGALELAQAIYEGMLPLAQRYGVTIAGGDTNVWDGPLAISVTLLGETTPRGPLRRDGARPGDAILVTGSLGGSILGHHFDFEPRVAEALTLHERYPLHAGMDISDGLSLDLWRLAEASGCGAVLQLDQIPVATAAVELSRAVPDGKAPWEHALIDGEDFELVLAVEPHVAQRMIEANDIECGLTRIGQFVAERGLWQTDQRGARECRWSRAGSNIDTIESWQ